MGFFDDIGDYFSKQYDKVKEKTGAKDLSGVIGAAFVNAVPGSDVVIKPEERAEAGKNLAKGAYDLAVLTPPALLRYFTYDAPRDVYKGTRDLSNSITGINAPTEYDYKTDDIFTNLADQMTYKYGPSSPVSFRDWKPYLRKPDFEKTRKRAFVEDPVGTFLDAAAVASGGSAAAGRGAQGVVRRSTYGTMANRAASSLAGLRKASEDIATAAMERPVTSRKDGTTYEPTTIPVRNSNAEINAARSPLTRARQRVRETAYGRIPTEAPVIGYFSGPRRGTRIRERPFNNIENRKLLENESIILEAMEGKKGPTDAEQIALWYRAQGIDKDIAPELLEIRKNELFEAISEDAPMTGMEFAEWMKEQGLKSSGRGTKRSSTVGEAKKRRERAESARTLANELSGQLDVMDLVADIRRLEDIVIPTMQKPMSPQAREAYEAMKAVDEVIQEEQVLYNMRERGMTRKEAEQSVVDRRLLPLTSVGITKRPKELPLILSHVVRHTDGAAPYQRMDSGVTQKRLAEQMENKGINWKRARYDVDPTIQLDALRGLIASRAVAERIERMAMTIEKYDPNKHAHLIDNTPNLTDKNKPLKLIKDKNDPLPQLVNRTNQSVEQLKAADEVFNALAETQAFELNDMLANTFSKISQKGNSVVINKLAYKELTVQYGGAKQLTDALSKNMNTWRHLVLSYKGSYYVNNFIGNAILVGLAYGPEGIVKAAEETLPKKYRGEESDMVSAKVSDLERSTLAASLERRANKGALIEEKKRRWREVIDSGGEKAQAAGVKVTEDNFRRGAFRANLARDARVLKRANNDAVEAGVPGAKKMTLDDAKEALMNDKQAVERLAQRTYDDLLDYSKLTPFEKQYMLKLYPFWNFTRAMSGRTLRLVMDEPWKIAVAKYLSTPNIEATAEMLDSANEQVARMIPDYLRGSIFFDEDGKLRVIMTGSANPFMAPYDTVRQGGNILGITDSDDLGSNFAASMGPVPKMFAETVSGRDVFYGNELEGGALQRAGGSLFRSIPQGQYFSKWWNRNDMVLDPETGEMVPKRSPYVERDGMDYILSYLGIPTGTLNEENVVNNANAAASKAFKNAATRWGKKWRNAESQEERDDIEEEGKAVLEAIIEEAEEMGVDTSGFTSTRFDTKGRDDDGGYSTTTVGGSDGEYATTEVG